MALVVVPTSRVREALRAPAAVGIDLLLVLVVGAGIGALMAIGHEVSAPLQEKVNIDLSYSALPRYTAMSLSRGAAGYVLSLIFTLIYGTVAAHNRRAEKLMIPALDVLQSIPVLGFLPGVVLAMINLFPARQLGLELACVIMIFTGQVWNMTFSYYGSVKAIPIFLREAAALQRLGRWQVFRLLEVPASMIGLVWNSMMSMAGGWFFLSVTEAFTLRDKDYRLPGLGSYMSEAINQGKAGAQIAAVIAMIVMIVACDQFFWRPIVVWSERYKIEEQVGSGAEAKSWVVNLLRRSRLLKWVAVLLKNRREALARLVSRGRGAEGAERMLQETTTTPVVRASSSSARLADARHWIGRALNWLLLLALLVGVAAGLRVLYRLLTGLPVHSPDHEDWVHVLLALLASFARITVAIAIGGAWSLPVGILIGLSPRWSRRLQPIVQVVASYPAPMIFPLVAAALALAHIPFGIGCVALMLLGAQWYTLFNVIAGATAIPADLKEAGAVYHMSRWQRWARIYIPSVFPYLLTGLITAAGGAWNATIVSEFVTLQGGKTLETFGLGAYITRAGNENNFPLLAASVVTMALFVVLVNRLFWKRIYHHAESRFSLNV
jgi:NitT/TauT family transport system permease protein